MSQTIDKLAAEVREEVGTPACRRLRKAGMVPCVVYTHGKEATNLKAAHLPLEKAIASPHIIELDVAGQGSKQVMVQDAQWSYTGAELVHVDFLEVAMDEKVHTKVPVAAVGVAKGTAIGGQLDQLVFELDVECLPGNLPEKLEVDVSPMEIDSHLNVSDIVFPEGVVARVDGTVCLFHVVPPRVDADAEGDEAEVAAE